MVLRWAAVAGAVLLAGALAACGDAAVPIAGDAGADAAPTTATVTGSMAGSRTTPAAPPGAAGATPPRGPSNVQVGEVVPGGSLLVLADGELEEDGSFRVSGVPAGRSGLMVLTTDSEGAGVGRVLVHGETRAGEAIPTVPVDATTTLEALVYERLTDRDEERQVRHAARISLLIHLPDSLAGEVAGSEASLDEVIGTYRDAARALVVTQRAAGADLSAQTPLLVAAAREEARARQAGADPEAGRELFIRRAARVFTAGGAEAGDAVLATAAAVTALDRPLPSAGAAVRLRLVRNAVKVNLRTRQRLASTADPGGGPTASVLGSARTRVDEATSIDVLAGLLSEVRAAAREEVSDLVVSRIPERASAELRSRIRRRLEGALTRADFPTTLLASGYEEGLTRAALEYRRQVRSAVEALVALLPDGASPEVGILVRLLVASGGGPVLEPGS